MNARPELAVCMPAYNAEKTIQAAIDSILKQTYSDFIFVITDDCSSDATVAIIQQCDDQRILLRRNEVNLGPAEIRNRMLDHCIKNGIKYMALMDADDIAFPARLEKQMAILASDPGLSAVGSGMEMEKDGGVWFTPAEYDELKVEAIFGNPLPTPMVIFRVDDLCERSLRWEDHMVPCDDYYLWFKFLFLHGLKVRSTGDIQGIYKFSPQGVSHKDGIIRQEQKDAEVKQAILKEIGIDVTSDQAFGFMKVGLRRRAMPEDIKAFIDVGRKLKASKTNAVSAGILSRALAERADWLVNQQGSLSTATRYRVYRDFIGRRLFWRAIIRSGVKRLRARCTLS